MKDLQLMEHALEALRLADALMEPVVLDKHMMQAAAELRRLYAANVDCLAHFDALMADYKAQQAVMQQALEALRVMLRDYAAVHGIGDVEMQPAIYQARAAIAKAEEQA